MNSDQFQKKLAIMTLDGEEVTFTEGETIYEVAQRHQKNPNPFLQPTPRSLRRLSPLRRRT